MRVVVLVKQTPQVSEVEISDKGAGWPDEALIVNPFDEYAVEEALRIKEKTGGAAIAVSYGQSSAEKALRDVLALGVDEAYLIEPEHYSYIDPQSAAQALAAAIRKIGNIDIVLTGKQATDDDSALVGASVAGYLDWPQIGFVKKFDSVENSKVVARRMTDTGYDVVESPLPVVCSVVKEINEPRLPSLKGKMRAKKAEIKRMSLAELGVDGNSPIAVKSIEPPKPRPAGEILHGEIDEVVEKLIEKLRADQVV